MYLPPNFDQPTRIINGNLDARRTVESGVVCGVLFLFLKNVLVAQPLKTRLITYLIVLTPIFVLGVIGIRGDSISQFIKALFLYLKNRKKLRYRRVDKAKPKAKGFLGRR